MEHLDGTIVTTAVPAIGDSLDTSPSSVSLVVTAYLIALAVLIPLSR
jgi:MFS family permease